MLLGARLHEQKPEISQLHRQRLLPAAATAVSCQAQDKPAIMTIEIRNPTFSPVVLRGGLQAVHHCRRPNQDQPRRLVKMPAGRGRRVQLAAAPE
jgi:hypothetical protein